MQSCLGIYVQDNLIKYAKISKEAHNKLKMEAYGVKFYETDIEKTIEQIVKETFSFQVPLSVNIEKEKYTYSDIFNLLKPQDVEKAIDTEFEYFCNNNNKNKNTIEYRKIKAPSLEDRDKLRVVYTYIDKANVVERIQLFDKYNVQNISPIATVIPNVNRLAVQENSVIVNIEQITEVTTIVNGKVYKVDKLENGMNKILNLIAEKENSIQKAYEICKNTTVYTKSAQNLKLEGNEYLDEIIAYLFEIIENVRDIITKNEIEINNIYITGMGIIINNIDLLFQENFIDKKCEILIPSFVEKTNVKINIKDYIEVNSAIALAIEGLNKEKDVNFGEKNVSIQKIWSFLQNDIRRLGGIKKQKEKPSFKETMKSEIDIGDKFLLRTTATLALVTILYIATTQTIVGQIKDKTSETNEVIEYGKSQIAKVTEYNTLIKSRTSEYQKMIDNIDEANSRLSENYSSKNAIPNLLNKIQNVIPQGVQLLSVENSTGKNITITAQAKLYDQLGYFKAALDNEGILTDITTTKGVKQNDLISITITGLLPY